MRGRMGRWGAKRGAALVLAVIAALSFIVGGMFQASAMGTEGSARQDYVRRHGKPVQDTTLYSQRPYERYDAALMEQVMADFEEACAAEGQEEEVLRLYEKLLEEFDRMSTMLYMAQLVYDRDVSDEGAASEQDYMADLYSKMGDEVSGCLKMGLESSYKQLLTEQMGEENAAYMQRHRETPQELTELNEKENDLLQEYNRLSAGECTVELEDGQWSYSRLEKEPGLSEERYEEIEEALIREKNRVLGGKYVELVRVRRRIAECRGYDNYAEYKYRAVYGRDYSMEEADKLCSYVKKQIVPLNDDIWNKDISQDSYDALDRLEESSEEDVLDIVGPAMEAVAPELGEIFRYMRSTGLCDMQSGEESENRNRGSYTVGLPSYGDAYIFLHRDNTFTDYQSLTHDFGHFITYYYNTVPELFMGYNVDVNEVQSQGLEMLATRYAKAMFGKGAEAYEFETVTDMLYVAITACMLQEFEEAVYTQPDMSLEEMNRKFGEIQDSYGAWYYQVYDEDMCYDWVDISHLFHSPLYYIGYGTSALSALDLWTLSREDWDGAVETYMGIVKAGMDAPYRETMAEYGLRDVFDGEELEALAMDVRRYQGLSGAARQEEEPAPEDGSLTPEDGSLTPEDGSLTPEDGSLAGPDTYQGPDIVDVMLVLGLGVVIVLQILILGVGIVIVWLLVKKRNEG